uniref:hypothetical protein n=1 Tax=Falsiroseomonas oryziterrae TaxID=2911368 RepID=UPI001F3798B0
RLVAGAQSCALPICVLARLQRRDPPVRTAAAAAPVWDALGLPEREALIYGPVAVATRPGGNTEPSSSRAATP